MTILRRAEYKALSHVELHGNIIDLGGYKSSEYHTLPVGDYEVFSANKDTETPSDFECDLERPLPFKDKSYDGVLLINVLEHIFEYRNLLMESNRILKKGGDIVIIAPFVFPYHASPNDYHRFSETALKKALLVSGFCDISVKPLVTGVFAARWLFIERLLPRQLRFLTTIFDGISCFLDWLFFLIARLFKKKYLPSDYALAYIATAKSS